MFKQIAVAIDGSQASSRAIAVDVAKQYEARLTIVHAVMGDASLATLMEMAERHGLLAPNCRNWSGDVRSPSR